MKGFVYLFIDHTYISHSFFPRLLTDLYLLSVWFQLISAPQILRRNNNTGQMFSKLALNQFLFPLLQEYAFVQSKGGRDQDFQPLFLVFCFVKSGTISLFHQFSLNTIFHQYAKFIFRETEYLEKWRHFAAKISCAKFCHFVDFALKIHDKTELDLEVSRVRIGFF